MSHTSHGGGGCGVSVSALSSACLLFPHQKGLPSGPAALGCELPGRRVRAAALAAGWSWQSRFRLAGSGDTSLGGFLSYMSASTLKGGLETLTQRSSMAPSAPPGPEPAQPPSPRPAHQMKKSLPLD